MAAADATSKSPSSTGGPPRILAIHAHPDDVEFQCAGTLALLAQEGCAITIATMTPGDCGSAEHSAEEIAEIRRGEARASAAILGAEYVCLEFRDLSITIDNVSRGKVCEALRRARPDIVLTAPPVDYMTDHELTSVLVREACFSASVPNYSTRQWSPATPLRGIPHLYYVDSVEGIDPFGRPVKPDFISRRDFDVRDQAKDAGLPRKPAQLAPQAARHRRIHGQRRTLVGRPRQRNRRQIRRSLPPALGAPVPRRQSPGRAARNPQLAAEGSLDKNRILRHNCLDRPFAKLQESD